MTAADDKARLRRRCLARRRALHAALPDAGERACAHLLAAGGFPPGVAVAAYLPVRDEFDVLPLARAAHRLGHVVAMPAVVGRAQPLAFRRWQPGGATVAGALDIPEPPATAPPVVPGLLLVPMMAFDGEGYRLGYGGGFYDRTLAALREDNPQLVAIGVCFADLELPRLPRDAHDRRLDRVATERGVRRFRPGRQQAR